MILVWPQNIRGNILKHFETWFTLWCIFFSSTGFFGLYRWNKTFVNSNTLSRRIIRRQRFPPAYFCWFNSTSQKHFNNFNRHKHSISYNHFNYMVFIIEKKSLWWHLVIKFLVRHMMQNVHNRENVYFQCHVIHCSM